MSIVYRWSRAALAGAVLAILGAAWVVFAPFQFGGQTAYVMVAGASMEPALRRGDLVIVRQTDAYQVGDIATYRHPMIGPIIHRIIGVQGNRYLFKGDANGWIDSYLPSREEIVGRFWLRLPGGGTVIRDLRQPIYLALLSMAVGLVAIRGPWNKGKRRAQALSRTLGDGFRALQPPDNVETLIFVLAAVGLASLLLAAASFGRPISQTAPVDIAYQHTGRFSYTAAVPRGIYDSATVQTGEPLFLRVSDRMRVQFEYQLEAEGVETLDGTIQLLAEVREQNGWNRTLTLYPETELHGNPATITGVLDFNEVMSYIHNLENRTGITRQVYTVAIYPRVIAKGVIAGEAFRDEFSPRLTFQLDPLQVSMIQEDLRNPELDPLHPTEAGSIPRTRSELVELTILGAGIPVLAARWLSALGLLFSMTALIVLMAAVVRVYRLGEPARIKLLYGHSMVSLQNGDVTPGERVVDVSSMEEVVRVAERKGETVLHQVLDSTHHYFVQDGPLTFHYQIHAIPLPAGGSDPEGVGPQPASEDRPAEPPDQVEGGADA